MNGGALLAAAQERYSKKKFLHKMQRKRFGFTEQPGGAWTWELWQDPVLDPVEQVTGSIVQLCQYLGVPFVRFRSAVPEEWLQGNVPQSIGRKFGLSASKLEEHRAVIHNRVADMLGRNAMSFLARIGITVRTRKR